MLLAARATKTVRREPVFAGVEGAGWFMGRYFNWPAAERKFPPAESKIAWPEKSETLRAMSEYRATIDWKMQGDDFVRGRFSRVHTWSFDGGLTVEASASPQVVPAAFVSEGAVDPEEAFVASVASCHMMTFLWVASRAKFAIAGYRDEAVGTMEKNEAGVPWVSEIVLHPRIIWVGETPDAETLSKLHEDAHRYCFIANSVKTAIRVASE